MGFIDDLPPDGLTEVEKVAIYLGILYIIATAITAWLITRKRSRAVRVVSKSQSSQSGPSSEVDDTSDITFDNDQDMLANLNAEMSGAITSLATIKQINDANEISQQAYNILEGEYMSIINEAKNQIAIMQHNLTSEDVKVEEHADISSRTDQMGEIEADLQAQLMELESDDDFLRPGRMKTPISRIDPSATPAEPAAAAGSLEAPQPPSKPETNQPTPMHSAPEPTNIAPPPKAAASMAPPPAAKVPTAMAPASPPPPSSTTPTPVAVEPVAAAQPKQVKNEESEQIFAKSTSIAALRMDMLRELARLKKLINEDD